ncbi:uncharacterized protein LOC133318374 [Gastrolobium bilobum]|uniref:uncharacterized protein LOC133318374 n=1 Tax=Gastrolobium bilobum TaxID=150636 RepID=UPI002AB0AFDC|nr:uncharacterized protein LOC133318374 [Gastrolobium bilobum]
MACNFFKTLFTEDLCDRRWISSGNLWPDHLEREKDSLSKVPHEMEIKQITFSMGAFKAPGIDGFPAFFFQKNWELIKSQKVVSSAQSSFVPQRHIQDNSIIVQELVHSIRRMRGKKCFMVIKVDLEKAYDRLNWKFIHRVLDEIQIPDKLSKLIMAAVTSPETNIIWNGKLTEEFQPSRGVRQGDPISPYLFVLAMEKLSHIIDTVVNENLWKPIRAGKGGPKISHLLFADDLMLFLEASKDQLNILFRCLNLFGDISRQKLQRAFIWGDTERKKHMHLIGWDTITRPKADGGLGLRKLQVINEAFLGKLVWNFVNDPDQLWVKTIGEKLANRAIAQISPTKAGKRVIDYVTHYGTWDYEIISNFLPDDCVQIIRSMLPPHESNGMDRKWWNLVGSNEVTVKNIYFTLLNQNSSNGIDKKFWSAIWNLKGPNRISLFLWKIAHHRLSTRSFLANFRLCPPSCPRK